MASGMYTFGFWPCAKGIPLVEFVAGEASADKVRQSSCQQCRYQILSGSVLSQNVLSNFCQRSQSRLAWSFLVGRREESEPNHRRFSKRLRTPGVLSLKAPHGQKAPSSFLLLVAMPGAPSSVLAPGYFH